MNFNFIGDFSEDNLTSDDIRYDKNLLTGCVNFSIVNLIKFLLKV